MICRTFANWSVAGIVCAFAVPAMAQTEWVDYPNHPVVELEDLGPWAWAQLSRPIVVFDGTRYHMWFVGRGGEQMEGTHHIGHATSSDGVDWTMDPLNPVLTEGTDGDWDDGGLSPGAVIHDGTQFHMWYSGRSAAGYRQTGYATSPDGSVWTKFSGNPVLPHGGTGPCDQHQHGAPTVIFDGESYGMWYAVLDSGVCFAQSSDGINWTKRAEPVLDSDLYPGGVWDRSIYYPSVFFDGSTYHMWYTGYVGAQHGFGYAFSSDGIEWFKHRDNPIIIAPDDAYIWNPNVLSDGSLWHMWYDFQGIHTAIGAGIYHATSDCCPGVAGLTKLLVIPAAAVTAGSEGAFFQTDVDLSNASDRTVQYEFLWLPRGENNADPTTSETFTLGAGMSARYTNVLTEVFGLEPNSVGAVALLSTSSDLLAMSRTYNVQTAETGGTCGQAIPALAPDELIQRRERRRIVFASENSDLRTNVGCQSTSDSTAEISYVLFNSDGTLLDWSLMVLRPWSNDQAHRVFRDYEPVDGYVEVWSSTISGEFYCYGSVLDNVTNDPTTILPQ